MITNVLDDTTIFKLTFLYEIKKQINNEII